MSGDSTLILNRSDVEIIIFDSSGTGLQDAAAAAAVYRRAAGQQQGVKFSFNA